MRDPARTIRFLRYAIAAALNEKQVEIVYKNPDRFDELRDAFLEIIGSDNWAKQDSEGDVDIENRWRHYDSGGFVQFRLMIEDNFDWVTLRQPSLLDMDELQKPDVVHLVDPYSLEVSLAVPVEYLTRWRS